MHQVHYFVAQGNEIALNKAMMALSWVPVFSSLFLMTLQLSLIVQGSPPVPTEKCNSSFPVRGTPCWKKICWPSHHANYLSLKGINFLVVVELTVFKKKMFIKLM